MLNESTSAPNPISQDRQERRLLLLQALRGQTDAILERLADELVDLPDDKVFGAIEYTLRDLSHDLATHAHQAGIEASKKKGATRAQASSARTAKKMPASSTTVPRPG
jgi:hypothetical protein